MISKIWAVLVVVLFTGLTRVDSAELGYCPAVSITDAILGFHDSISHPHNCCNFAVFEGDEETLQRVLHFIYSHSQEYVAILFYASWCPFSRKLRPTFSTLFTLYPSIAHFAIEESAVRPSILSKYGVHGFPTLYLMNSTMRVHYRGSRSLSSLVSFYRDVTGIKGDPRDQLPFDKIKTTSNQERSDNEAAEDCPFSWARSPENLLRQETYLALATMFVLVRLLYLLFPYFLEFTRRTWRSYMEHIRLTTLWEHPLRYLNKTKQYLSSFRDPRKGSNFQEGAINARAWASKSLASAVSIGDASTSRVPIVSSSL